MTKTKKGIRAMLARLFAPRAAHESGSVTQQQAEMIAWMKTNRRIPPACWEENDNLYDVVRAAMRVTKA